MLKSLILKDFYIMKEYKEIRKTFLAGFIIALLFSYLVGKESASMVLAIINISMIFRIYDDEEKNNTLGHIKYAPVKLKYVVIEKFLINLILMIISYLLTLLILGICSLMGNAINMDDLLSVGLVYFVLFTIYLSYIPILYKFSLKYSTIFVCIMSFILVLISGLVKSLNILPTLHLSDLQISLIIIGICILFILISYTLSIRILKNKDFK